MNEVQLSKTWKFGLHPVQILLGLLLGFGGSALLVSQFGLPWTTSNVAVAPKVAPQAVPKAALQADATVLYLSAGTRIVVNVEVGGPDVVEALEKYLDAFPGAQVKGHSPKKAK